MDSAKKIKNALNNALADCKGVFWEDVKDVQLQGLLKTMTRQYFLDDGKVQKAVTIVGRQPVDTPPKNHLPENDVYVFKESIQVRLFMSTRPKATKYVSLSLLLYRPPTHTVRETRSSLSFNLEKEVILLEQWLSDLYNHFALLQCHT